MVLNNVKLLNQKNAVAILIDGAKISSVTSSENTSDPFQLEFENVIAFPGLINSHDHLDFNLFPALGNKIYNNYAEWGTSIHINYKKEIDAVLKIPEQLRVEWGIYKNLLCGVTTVVNHGKHLHTKESVINVIQPAGDLHSVGFERHWKLKLNNPVKRGLPCVIHVGEGTDKRSEEEIDELIRWNLLKRKLIAVHGVAMNEQQAGKFKALIWCPASNFFLFNNTAPINKLKNHTKICFGTDSTLTSGWNILDHARLARDTGLVNDKELFEMLTTTPAVLWGLNCGMIAPGKNADIVIARAKENSFDALYSINPEDILLVVHNGNIRLFDATFEKPLSNHLNIESYSKIKITGNQKFVSGDIYALVNKIKYYQPLVGFPETICVDNA